MPQGFFPAVGNGVYPLSTRDPRTTETPQRTADLAVQGTILPGVEYVMAALQQVWPRLIFPAGDIPVDARSPQFCPTGWRRGGTSPGGASLGGTPGGNYFVGVPELKLHDAAPQRIIWEPPGEGEEERIPPQTIGYYKDAATAMLPQLHSPQTSATEEHFRQLGAYASPQINLRVIPMKCHIWGLDWGDTETLLHWVESVFTSCFQGTLNGQWLCGPSGWIRDEKASHGLHAVTVCRLVAPIVYPYMGEREAVAASLRFSGAAPNTVVVEE